MVCKITSGKDLFGLLKYNETKVNKGEAEILGGSKILGSHFGWENISMTEKMGSFDDNLEANQRTEKVTFHVSLNPDVSDKLSNQQLTEVANQYMERMGYGEQPYLIYKHNDIEREHIHIVSIRVDEAGVKIKSDFEKLKSEEIRKSLELEYNLTQAQGRGKQENIARVPVFSRDLPTYGKSETKAAISGITKTIINDYKYGSFNELRTLLELNGIEMRKVEGQRLDGSEINGIQYQFIDDKHNAQGQPIAASRLGKDRGATAIQEQIEKNIPRLNDTKIKNRVKEAVDGYFKKETNPTMEGLREALATEKIIPVFRFNEAGKLYGASFVDNINKAVFNGSKLGKEYSANRMEERLTGVPYPDLNAYERKLVTDVLKGTKPDYGKIPITAIRPKKVLKLLMDRQQVEIIQQINRNYANIILKELKNSNEKSFPVILGKLVENGVFVQPVKNEQSGKTDYQVGYYKLPFKGMVPAGEGLTNFFNSQKYSDQHFNETINIAYRKNKAGELKVSPKFDMLVKISQAERLPNNSAVIFNSLTFIDKINNSLYLELLKNANVSEKNRGENYTKEELKAIKITIANYPSDNLRVPNSRDHKAYINEMGNSKGLKNLQELKPTEGAGGVLSLFGSLFDSLMETEHGRKEDHREEPSKRKGRKRRW